MRFWPSEAQQKYFDFFSKFFGALMKQGRALAPGEKIVLFNQSGYLEEIYKLHLTVRGALIRKCCKIIEADENLMIPCWQFWRH